MEKTDGMPSYMCNDCVMHLSVATSFKEQCLKSDAQLREALATSFQNDVKSEQINSEGDVAVIIKPREEETEKLVS